MKLIPLASGSSGNSYFVQANGTSILVDAGLSAKQLIERMEKSGSDPHELKGILVSHGHSDHVKGAGVLSRKLRIPILINRATWKVIENSAGKVHDLIFFKTGQVFEFGGLKIRPFSVPHDCADPVAFKIMYGTEKVGIVTDLGMVTNLTINLLTDLQVIVLESNHDPKMLMAGPYPWELKQRVKSRFGHLSNDDSASLLRRVVTDELQAVILAHMSKTNNTSDLALAGAEKALSEFLARGGVLGCAEQNEIGPVCEW
jgi:phosphoribosyl 1,2-cyclic phosphodiesterase